uniref:Uncharacterized protein n=1 Tax=viral metagenome TaxID=1070528 RepID=A0A6M3KWN9_9ZZZZ
MKVIDLEGVKFGALTAIERISYKNNGGKYKSKWKCFCDCGNICYVITNNLTCGNSTSCGCLINKRKPEISYGLWKNIISNAKTRSIEVFVNREQLYNLLLKQNNKCYLTGDNISLGYGRKWWYKNTASLDRINSNLPYTYDNCKWCHKKINSMRGTLTLDDFIWWCNKVCNPLSNNTKTKYCKILKRNNKWKTGYGNISGMVWLCIQHNAKRRKINFDLDIKDIWKLFLQQNGRCAITRLALTFNIRQNKPFGTASLDRIDSLKGYTIDNVQWTHQIINKYFKWNLTEEEMYCWAQKILDYYPLHRI